VTTERKETIDFVSILLFEKRKEYPSMRSSDEEVTSFSWTRLNTEIGFKSQNPWGINISDDSTLCDFTIRSQLGLRDNSLCSLANREIKTPELAATSDHSPFLKKN
jgi:hypothetical protein